MQIFVKSSVPSQQETDNIPNEISRQATRSWCARARPWSSAACTASAATAESGVPYLRSVLFGWLFKNSLLRDNQELLVFITPRIVWHQSDDGTLPTAGEPGAAAIARPTRPTACPGSPPVEPVATR